MKKSILISTFALCFFSILSAQKNDGFKIGLRGGLSTTNIDVNQLLVTDQASAQELGIAVKDAKYGVHAGLFMRGMLGKSLFIQPEILFNSNSVDYEVIHGGMTDVLNEKYQYLDIPLFLGLKFGPLRVQGGPVGHVFLNSTSEIEDKWASYKQDFNNLELGWQLGAGLDIWAINLDFRYEGNFANYGDHFNFFGNQYEFSDSPSRLIFSVGLTF